MNAIEWREHIERRSDFTTRVTHLTRRTKEISAIEVLYKILDEKKLIGSGYEGKIVGTTKCVCFQDVPLYSLAENVKYEFEVSVPKGQIRYEAFGIRVNKQSLYSRGGRPVFYDDSEVLKGILPEEQHWRIVKLKLDSTDNVVDWSHEREWRYPGDFAFEYSDIEVILRDKEAYQQFIEHYLEQNPTLLKQINGIVVLQSVVN